MSGYADGFVFHLGAVRVADADVSVLSRTAQCEQVKFPHLNRHIGRQRTKSEVWFNRYTRPLLYRHLAEDLS